MITPTDFVLDFDGTVVTEIYDRNDPTVHGEDLHLCVPTLKALVENQHRLVLWTMRDGAHLDTAKKWFTERGIDLFQVNFHPDQWTSVPKVFGHVYIDDRALGIPLRQYKGGRHVCWVEVSLMLYKANYITYEQYRKIQLS